MLLRRPTTFFRELSPASLGPKVTLLGVFCLFVGNVCSGLTQFFLASIDPVFFNGMIKPAEIVLMKKQAILTLLFSPAIAFFGIFLFASALHFLIKNLISANLPTSYETTVRLVALAQVPMLFSIVPLLGPIIAPIWSFILLMKALKGFYGLSLFMAVMSTLAPALFLKLTWGWALQMLSLSL